MPKKKSAHRTREVTQVEFFNIYFNKCWKNINVPATKLHLRMSLCILYYKYSFATASRGWQVIIVMLTHPSIGDVAQRFRIQNCRNILKCGRKIKIILIKKYSIT